MFVFLADLHVDNCCNHLRAVNITHTGLGIAYRRQQSIYIKKKKKKKAGTAIVSKITLLSSLTSYDPSRWYAKIPDLPACQKAATVLQFRHFVTVDLRYSKYSMDKMPKLLQNYRKRPELQ